MFTRGQDKSCPVEITGRYIGLVYRQVYNSIIYIPVKLGLDNWIF